MDSRGQYCEGDRVKTFQESLSSTRLSQQFVASVRMPWENSQWLKAGLRRWNPWRDRSKFARALPVDSLLPAVRCGTCHYFRSDPAWVAGVFSGFPGLDSGYASACAADGMCRLSHRLRSAAFSCEGFRR
jgi:hypothetical protein